MKKAIQEEILALLDEYIDNEIEAMRDFYTVSEISQEVLKVYVQEQGDGGFIHFGARGTIKYEFVLASETFDDDNNGYEYGINWLDDDEHDVLDCQWFKTEEERINCINQLKQELADER